MASPAQSLLPVLPKSGSAISAAQVAHWEQQVAANVAGIDDMDVLNEWRAQAAALEAYLRSRDMQAPMLGAARRTEGRIGQLLGEPSHVPGSATHAEDLARGGDRRDFRLLGRALSGHCELTEEEWRKTRRALVSLVRQRLGLMPETPDLPDGQFACIVADPPWQLDSGPDVFGGTIESGHDALAYQQMALDAISELGVQSLAADDAHLYLWTTNRYLRHAYSIAEAWGFKPSVPLVWCKQPRGVGLGDTFRLTTEFVLFARRGNLPHARIVPTTWFNWPRGRHSAKPAEFYELVETVTPGPYVDLFARTARDGWTVWGDEAPAEESA
jgi:N6-adenosine-specific RNA methylase IME4